MEGSLVHEEPELSDWQTLLSQLEALFFFTRSTASVMVCWARSWMASDFNVHSSFSHFGDYI